jgi:hypothetical protein
MAGATIEFAFASPDDELRFLRRYLPEAWDRFEAGDYWKTGWFRSYRQFVDYDCGPDGGLVRLVFEGDPDALVEAESDRWQGTEGLADWRLRRYETEGYDSLLAQQRDAKGDRGGEWEYRVKPVVSRFSLAVLRKFDDLVPAAGGSDEANPKGIGFWAAMHDQFVQCGYGWYDETAACRKALKTRLKSIAVYRGVDAARAEYEAILADWEAYGDELEDWLEANPTGTVTDP